MNPAERENAHVSGPRTMRQRQLPPSLSFPCSRQTSSPGLSLLMEPLKSEDNFRRGRQILYSHSFSCFNYSQVLLDTCCADLRGASAPLPQSCWSPPKSRTLQRPRLATGLLESHADAERPWDGCQTLLAQNSKSEGARVDFTEASFTLKKAAYRSAFPAQSGFQPVF